MHAGEFTHEVGTGSWHSKTGSSQGGGARSRARSSLWAYRVRPVLWAHRVNSRAHSVPWAHRVRSRARPVPWAHRFSSRARSVPGAHRIRSVPGAHRVRSRARSVPGAHRARYVPVAHRARSASPQSRSVPGAHRVHFHSSQVVFFCSTLVVSNSAGPALASCPAGPSWPPAPPWHPCLPQVLLKEKVSIEPWACRHELAEGEQSFCARCESTFVCDSPHFFALRPVWNGLNFTKCLDFIKWLCNHDFLRISFAAKLSNNLVYNNIFLSEIMRLWYIYFSFVIFHYNEVVYLGRLCLRNYRSIEILHW